MADVLGLRQRVAELENELERERTEAPAGTESLVQGEGCLSLDIDFEVSAGAYSTEWFSGEVHPTWNEIFAAMAPSMMVEASDAELAKTSRRFVADLARDAFGDDKNLKGRTIRDGRPKKRDLETILVQFRALGLIRQSDRKRSVKDTGNYWTLTPYGDRLMVQLRALRRDEDEREELNRQDAYVGRRSKESEEDAEVAADDKNES